ncbi:3-oxoacyl-[acyl-carrier-protein] reductase [bacterium]|nr:3-oxoacyl-[acyl-carrier-protein] reductase [bacterium]
MFKDKVVVITGAFGGIGRSLATKFGAFGARLVLWDVNINSEFETELKEKKIETISSKIDITNKKEIEENLEVILQKWGKVDILINNAGITKDTLVIRMEEEDWDSVLNVNLKGTFLCSKIVGKSMLSKRFGKIVNVASIIGQIGNIGQANYSASKGGMISLTKTCAREFGRFGVNVNAVAPGYIMTPMTERLPEKVKNDMEARVPLRRFGTSEEVSDLIVFLASDSSAYITGQVFRVDGGLVM